MNESQNPVYSHPPRRIAPLDPERLTPDQQAVADRIAGTRGRVPGPFSALLHVPELADRVQSLGAHLRYQGSLDRDLAEVAILVVATRWGSTYVWNAHAPIASRAGAPEAVLQCVQSSNGYENLSPRYRIVCDYARELAIAGRVPDALYATTAETLGTAQTIELTVLVGYYSLVSMTLNALGWK